MKGGAAAGGQSLAARFRDGDREAVRAVYREHSRAVYGVAYRALGDRTLAEEAVQQTFLQAWRAAHTVDGSRDIGPWLFTIARRVAIDLYRKESRRAHANIDDVPSESSVVVTLPPSVESAFTTWEVRSAVSNLPDDEREVVRLQHFEGLSHQEVADRLAIPVGTVKSRSFRAHRRLAGRLGHLRDGSVEEQP